MLMLLMIKRAKMFLLLSLVFISFKGITQDIWKLSKESNGIKVYTKHEKNLPFKTFKGEITLEASLEKFVAVLSDVKGLENWGYKVKEITMLEKFGDTLQIYYSEAKAPFPYNNRDGVYSNKFNWNDQKKSLVIDIEILDEYMPEQKNLVRIKGSGFWEAKPIPNNKLEVTFQMYINPGGSIPNWLVNAFVDDTPFVTLKNLRKIIQKTNYHIQKFSFIK